MPRAQVGLRNRKGEYKSVIGWSAEEITRANNLRHCLRTAALLTVGTSVRFQLLPEFEILIRANSEQNIKSYIRLNMVFQVRLDL